MSSPGSSTKPRKPPPSVGLEGRRILVVEDSPVVAPFTVEVLREIGCEVVGPAPTMAVARELMEGEEFDAALIDVHIRGDKAFPLCELIDAKGVPFVFTSGYADWQMPEKWIDRPRLQKPYSFDQLEAALKKLFSPKGRPREAGR